MSEWIDILIGILQGSTLGPLLFNIFINDLIMFTEKSDICNFADDNTLYKSSPSLSVVLNCLEHDITIVLNWFKINPLKATPPPLLPPQKNSVFCFRRKKKLPI